MTIDRVHIRHLFHYWDSCAPPDLVRNVRKVYLFGYTQPDFPVVAWLPELCERLSENALSAVSVRDYWTGEQASLLTDECIRSISSLRTIELRLCENQLTATPSLANIATNASLLHLNMEGNRLGDAGVEMLLSTPFRTLQTLELQRNGLTDASIALIQDALREGRLPATISAIMLNNASINLMDDGTPIFVMYSGYDKWKPPTRENAFSMTAVEPLFRAMASRPTWIILTLDATGDKLLTRGASNVNTAYLGSSVRLWTDTSSQSSSP